mgnify:CR=1 FL=1
MLTPSQIRDVLDYDVETGVLTWRISSGTRKAGQKAGGIALEYLSVGIKGKRYQAHRLAWAHYFGEWPSGEVDHINRDKLDNRIVNLRVASRAQNGANCSLSKSNTSGAKGVTWVRREGKWQAQIMVGRKHRHLGYFDSVATAAAAYNDAAIKAFGEFASTNDVGAAHVR